MTAQDAQNMTDWKLAEQNRLLADLVARNEPRLRSFIRRRVLDAAEADDILQEVFSELVESYRLVKPIEQVTAWLYRVARNRITDLFRRQRTVSLQAPVEDETALTLEDLLPSPEAGPDAVYARNVLVDLLEDALAELPDNQREVFLAHEVEGLSFKEIADQTGVGINTLLSRKHYAVLHLRQRLEEMHDSFGRE